ncbi:thioesterase II family protein [Actinomadura bangladeshensis]|uniref:Thioesterase n=1 Tax=Actinomadura bangladeshensis TaxID=453573 RepID=A0A4R4P2M2_9ACTN|nr:alpha/beta fold hydrolase [Actinomadura bangladeshensis]TDC14953.1 thioesterase [Actinomadura bangladeshensis]
MADTGTGTEQRAWFPGVTADPEAAVRLICFPHAGGTPSVYRDWDAHVGEHVQIVPVLLPGRSFRLEERPRGELRPMAEDIAAALIDGGLAGSHALFGHSMGALLAYEVACELRDRGAGEPVHLFVSGSRAPHFYGDRIGAELTDDALLRMVRDLGGLTGAGVDPRSGGPQFARRMPVLRADLTACERYRWAPRRPLRCPITAFSAAGDPIAAPAQVDEWREYTYGSTLRRHLPGGHFYLAGPDRDALLRELRRELGGHPRAHTIDPRRTRT